jgi:hypothetical protein
VISLCRRPHSSSGVGELAAWHDVQGLRGEIDCIDVRDTLALIPPSSLIDASLQRTRVSSVKSQRGPTERFRPLRR